MGTDLTDFTETYVTYGIIPLQPILNTKYIQRINELKNVEVDILPDIPL